MNPPEPSTLEQSRDKARIYLADGREFALTHTFDHRLALGQPGMDLAISYCASQLMKDDRSKSVEYRDSVARVPFTGFLLRLVEGNIRVIDLAEDFLERERQTHIQTTLSDRPETYPLGIRQAVQNLFAIQRSGMRRYGKEYGQKVQEWGDYWRSQIARSQGQY